MKRNATCVVTTIQEPTESVRLLHERLSREQINLIVVGDKKGPARFELPNTKFLSLDEQLQSNFKLALLLPTGHYSRKNLGYLEALRDPELAAIYDTDDDNFPDPRWRSKDVCVEVRTLRHNGWFNIYRCFSRTMIWPRGFPLNRIHDTGSFAREAPQSVYSPIQQLLCNDAPDVDAVWRLTVGQKLFLFDSDSAEPIHLAPGTWCPFNSQATWWFADAFPLLYLPSTCTFRMTDIWRSFIAQRCLWELGMGVTFHPPIVIQDRNAHNLMKDFEDEIPGYLHNESIAQTLSALSLNPSKTAIADNLIKCYESLIAKNIFPKEEMPLLCAWLDDLQSL